MSTAPLEALIAWDRPVTYGMPVLYDDAELAKQAEATLTKTVTAVLGEAHGVMHRVERGHAAAVLVAASKHARLLVLGPRGHGTFAAALLGSVSQQCIHHAHCPVVVVRD